MSRRRSRSVMVMVMVMVAILLPERPAYRAHGTNTAYWLTPITPHKSRKRLNVVLYH
jgi:hypothetical protein